MNMLIIKLSTVAASLSLMFGTWVLSEPNQQNEAKALEHTECQVKIKRLSWERFKVTCSSSRSFTISALDSNGDTIGRSKSKEIVVPDLHLDSAELFTLILVFNDEAGGEKCFEMKASPKTYHLNSTVTYPLASVLYQGAIESDVVVHRPKYHQKSREEEYALNVHGNQRLSLSAEEFAIKMVGYTDEKHQVDFSHHSNYDAYLSAFVQNRKAFKSLNLDFQVSQLYKGRWLSDEHQIALGEQASPTVVDEKQVDYSLMAKRYIKRQIIGLDKDNRIDAIKLSESVKQINGSLLISFDAQWRNSYFPDDIYAFVGQVVLTKEGRIQRFHTEWRSDDIQIAQNG